MREMAEMPSVGLHATYMSLLACSTMNAFTYNLDYLCEHTIHVVQVFYLHTPPRHGCSCISISALEPGWYISISKFYFFGLGQVSASESNR